MDIETIIAVPKRLAIARASVEHAHLVIDAHFNAAKNEQRYAPAYRGGRYGEHRADHALPPPGRLETSPASATVVERTPTEGEMALPDGITQEERRKASALVHRNMLIRLWVETLRNRVQPDKYASEIGNAMLGDLEWLMSMVAGRDAEVTQNLATEEMETMWADIQAALRNLGEPASPPPAQ